MKMGVDRNKYVMSMEVAMQREMAYRQRLERERPEELVGLADAGPLKDPMPVQVQTPIISQVPRTISISTPIFHPSTPMLIQNPRPHPSVAPRLEQAPLQVLNPQQQGVTPNRSLQVRQPSFQGPHSTFRHYWRPNHLAPHKRKTAPHQAKHHKRILISPEDFYCNLCETNCQSEMSLRMHLKGHKHKAKLKEAQAMKVDSGTTGKVGKIHCDLCRIWCTDMTAFNMHLKGKNHVLKLYASEQKLKCSDGGSALT